MGIGGQILADGIEPLGDELAGSHDVHAPIELYVGDGQADGAGGADTAHAGHAVYRTFDGERDVLLHLVGGEAGGFGHDDHGRGVELRENIDGRFRQTKGDHGEQKPGGEQDQRCVDQREFDES